MIADVLSTALYVTPPERSLKMLANYEGVSGRDGAAFARGADAPARLTLLLIVNRGARVY